MATKKDDGKEVVDEVIEAKLVDVKPARKRKKPVIDKVHGYGNFVVCPKCGGNVHELLEVDGKVMCRDCYVKL